MSAIVMARNAEALLCAEHLSLSAMDERHVQTLRRWKSNKALAHSIAAYPREFSLDDVRQWLDSSNADSNQVFLGIFSRADQHLLGIARLMFIDWISRVAELGIYFGDVDVRGKGFGKEAVGALLRHAFMDLALERVHLKVLVENKAAIRCYEACGFQREGVMRSHFSSESTRHDMLIMGILREEFCAMNQPTDEG